MKRNVKRSSRLHASEIGLSDEGIVECKDVDNAGTLIRAYRINLHNDDCFYSHGAMGCPDKCVMVNVGEKHLGDETWGYRSSDRSAHSISALRPVVELNTEINLDIY